MYTELMYFVYILELIITHSYYIGSTNNLSQRLKEHNSGSGHRYTRNKGPWLLKYSEEYNTLTEARNREYQIKSWKKRKNIERLFALIV